ncbi:hypothetical protein ACFLSJ_01605 [Verrucomicrobiota bacterium]
MKRIVLHLTCHGIALGLVIAAGITGYIFFAPIGFLFEIVFWVYVLALARKRREARMRELFGEDGSDETGSRPGS